MLLETNLAAESPSPSPSPSPALCVPPDGKRYVPPYQRNRRKSGDRSDGTSSTTPLSLSRSVSDADTSRSTSSSPLIVTLYGCSTSDASRLLRHSWKSAINAFHDPSMASSSHRPLMYSGVVELPHQLMSASQNHMDFLLQLRRAIDQSRVQQTDLSAMVREGEKERERSDLAS